jgi:uncharacterized protein YjiS (DUF1127 family)
MTSYRSNTQLDLFVETAGFSQADVDRAIHVARQMRTDALSQAVAAAARRFVAFVRARRERARVMAELNAMSNSQLADIGLTRGDIAAVAAGIDPLAGRRNAKPSADVVTLDVTADAVTDTPRLAA